MRPIALAAIALCLTGTCFAHPPVAAFSFNEGSGRRATDSMHSQAATISSPRWVPGVSGSALSFADETSAVRVGRRPWLNLDQALTLEAWICPPEPGDTSRIIIAKNDEYLLRIDKAPEGGRISFFVQVGTPAVTWEPRVSSKAPPEPGKWSHVVATWDGANLRMYLNGELQAERERVGFPNPNPYPVMIGNFEYPSCHGGNFGGLIDEVRIYCRALSEDEVVERFHANAATSAHTEG